VCADYADNCGCGAGESFLAVELTNAVVVAASGAWAPESCCLYCACQNVFEGFLRQIIYLINFKDLKQTRN